MVTTNSLALCKQVLILIYRVQELDELTVCLRVYVVLVLALDVELVLELL
jgi:hypothetical protein